MFDRKAYAKEYYKRNREKILAQNATWKETNKEKHLAKCKEYRDSTPEQQAEYGRNNNRKRRQKELTDPWYRSRRILWGAKRRARERGLDFNLEVEDLAIPDVCPILNQPFDLTPGRTKMSPSVDRIIPELGYVKGNVRIISDLANRMKQEATYEELEQFATNILQYASIKQD